MSIRSSSAALVLSLGLTACTVGPDYEPPLLETPDAWNASMRADIERADEEALANWWTLIGDPVLNSLVEEAVTGNLDLQAAIARIDEAQAIRGQARGLRKPEVVLGAEVAGQKVTETGLFPPPASNPSEVYDVGVGAGWELDVFGRLQRAVESAEAGYQATVEDYRNVRVILVGEVAGEYVDFRTLMARIRVAEQNVERQAQSLDLAERRFNAGVVSRLDVTQATSNLASTESLIPALESEVAVSRNRLTLLLGKYPGELDEVLAAAVDPPTLEVLPDTGLPRNLLRRRPDVRRQERLLAAQTARIGVAQADLYPRFNLLGFLGLSTITFGDLADGDSGTWRLGLPVTWNIFSGGRLRARVAQEEARTRAALLAYQETVLAAVTEVETTIASAAKLYEFRTTLQRALAATRESAVLVQKQYEAGVLDFQRVIDVERTLLLQEDQLAVVNGDLVNSLVRLYRALGGGWSPEGDPLLVPPSTSG